MNIRNSRSSRFAVMTCCAVMLIPIAMFFVAGGTVSGLNGNLAVFAPLLFCVGAHLLLHRFIGGLCNGCGAKQDNVAEAVSPQVRQVTER